jgi:hypothetical protein
MLTPGMSRPNPLRAAAPLGGRRAAWAVPRYSTPATPAAGTPMTAPEGFVVPAGYTLVLDSPKSMTMTANSPTSSKGSSIAVPSAVIKVAPAEPGSPSQSASPVMHKPVLTPERPGGNRGWEGG